METPVLLNAFLLRLCFWKNCFQFNTMNQRYPGCDSVCVFWKGPLREIYVQTMSCELFIGSFFCLKAYDVANEAYLTACWNRILLISKYFREIVPWLNENKFREVQFVSHPMLFFSELSKSLQTNCQKNSLAQPIFLARIETHQTLCVTHSFH